ncbi:MAG: TIGR04282 family arsenosugar biosynthesis glycosyltransferase [Betaproteobacteria bacterium]
MGASTLVIVFARAPLPGRVKTRLIAALGAWRAARLHMQLVRRALRTARAARCGPVELHGSASHTLFRQETFRVQRGADLGERMHRATSAALRRHAGVILIGADCPELRPGDLRRAARLLRAGYQAVLAPAEDGGYALVALSRAQPELFRGVAWGTDAVWRQTVSRLQAAGTRWRALRRVWDVDRPEDLARLKKVHYMHYKLTPGER